MIAKKFDKQIFLEWFLLLLIWMVFDCYVFMVLDTIVLLMLNFQSYYWP